VIAGSIDELPVWTAAPDVLIVGGGACGIALAVQLARAGRRVTLLEAGPREPTTDWQAANSAGSSGRAHLGLLGGRMQALGGTTRLWGGQLLPFAAEDLAAETYPGKPGWPIPFAQLQAATQRARKLLGQPEAAQDTLATYVAATGAAPQLGDGLDLVVATWLRQPDFAKLFAVDLVGNRNLAVLTGHRVAELEFATHGVVTAVHCAGGAKFSAPQVVLANGTFELVGLLLRTAQSESNCGFADNPHLGAGYIDHLHGIVGTLEPVDRQRLGQLFDPLRLRGVKYTAKLKASATLRAAAGTANAAAMLLAPLSLGELARDTRDLLRRALAGRGGLGAGLRQLAVLLPLALRYLAKRRQGALWGPGIRVGVEVEQVTCSESRITLDPTDPQRVVLHWALDGAAEMCAIRSLALELQSSFAAQGLGTVTLDPRVETGDPTLLDGFHDAYHQMGGARMASSAAEGVVNSQLKVFGTENLYALGAATFPSGSFANPTLTALALSVRLADHLIALDR
jgi:choline dehydrogenase-like flavoprotein